MDTVGIPLHTIKNQHSSSKRAVGDVDPSSGSHGTASHQGCQQELKWASIHSSPNRAGKGGMERKAVPPTQLEQLAHWPNPGQAWLNRIPLPHRLLSELSSHKLMRSGNE